MAKVLYGNGIANMSGSLAGNVHSHNRGGTYTRQRRTPTNPNTTFQQEVRDTLASLNKAWGSDLTQAQRDDWISFADGNPITDTLGAQIILTGNQMYTRLNNVLEAAGLPRIDDTPANLSVDSLTTMTATWSLAADLSVVFTPTPLAANMRLQFLSTPSLSPGVTFVKDKLRLFTTRSVGTASPQGVADEWNARFGTSPVIGRKIVLLARVVNDDNGALSQPLRADVIVAA